MQQIQVVTIFSLRICQYGCDRFKNNYCQFADKQTGSNKTNSKLVYRKRH